MASYAAAATVRPDFLVSLGDNFYTKGVYSTSDPMWDYLWSNVYLGYSSLQIPWYRVLGNHDYGYGSSGVNAQLARQREHTDDDFWRMPSTNYSQRYDLPDNSGCAEIIYIDTTTLAPSVNQCCNNKG